MNKNGPFAQIVSNRQVVDTGDLVPVSKRCETIANTENVVNKFQIRGSAGLKCAGLSHFEKGPLILP
jgi:hypothetical protein